MNILTNALQVVRIKTFIKDKSIRLKTSCYDLKIS